MPLPRIVDRAVRTFNRKRFDITCREILNTPPIETGRTDGTDVLTMLRHADVPMYLAALKSFARYVPVNTVHIVNDGTLLTEDLATIAHHAPGTNFLNVADFRSERCPTGGCWERLLAICEVSKTRYVIQLDADTLAVDDIPEVRDHFAARRSFTIGTWDRQTIDTMQASNDPAKRTLATTKSGHVQIVAEASFDKLRDFKNLNYVRGCAGFMGFAPATLDKTRIEELSSEIEENIGPVWKTWGSEQVMANILIANTAGAAVLPHPKYCNCERIQSNTTSFIHFVGSCRFKNRVYADNLSSTIANISYLSD